jgi:hypothetical protein
MKTFILKGLEETDQSEEVFEALNMLNLPNVKIEKVFRLETNKSKRDGKILPIFVVQTAPESSSFHLTSTRYLLSHLIKWEMPKRSDILQCKRCQRFGHTAFNCRMLYRCVKGCLDHEPGKCPIEVDENNKEKSKEKLYCVLCKTSGHPSSFRGCSVYMKLKAAIEEKKEARKQALLMKSQMYQNFVSPQVKYSEAASLRQNTNITPQNIPNNFNNSDFIDFKKTLENFNEKFETLKNYVDTVVKKQEEAMDCIRQLLRSK